MLDIDVTMTWIARQMGLELAPLLFGKVGSAHRPTTIQSQLSSVRQTLGASALATACRVRTLGAPLHHIQFLTAKTHPCFLAQKTLTPRNPGHICSGLQ